MLYINKTAICNLRTFSFTAMRMTDDQLCMSFKPQGVSKLEILQRCLDYIKLDG